jgi:hypothetical protein
MSRDRARQNVPQVTLIGTRRAFEHERRTSEAHWIEDNLHVLRTAVKAKAAQVELNGKTYSIEYEHVFPSKLVTDYRGECVLLRPTNGDFAPRGYVSYKRMGLK